MNVYKICAVLGRKCITDLCYYLSCLLDGTEDLKPPACGCNRVSVYIVSFQTPFGKACLLKFYYFSYFFFLFSLLK